MQPALIDMCSAGGPRLLRQPLEIEIRKWVVGAASVAEGYTCKATPTSPPPPILVVHTLAIQLVELHLRNDHTPSSALTKRQAHNLSDMVRIVFFCCVVYLWCFIMAGPCPESEVQALFCILLGFQPPPFSGRSGCALYPLIDSSYGRQICAEEAENARKASSMCNGACSACG